MAINKTQQAFLALSELVKEITSDGRLTKSEIEQLMDWRLQWRTVVKRPVLKPFTEWFDGAVADGKITRKEAAELLAWANDLANHSEHEEIKSRRLMAAEQWKSHPISEAQVQLLTSVGMPESEALKMTKGQASDRIESIQESLPATEKQKSFLRDLGYSVREINGVSKRRASEMIDQRLSERDFFSNAPSDQPRDHRGRFKAKESGCLLFIVCSIGVMAPMTAVFLGWMS